MTRVTTACHHMLAAVQTQGGPHPGAAARVLGLVGWTRETRAHWLPHLASQGQLPALHKTELWMTYCSACSVHRHRNIIPAVSAVSK